MVIDNTKIKITLECDKSKFIYIREAINNTPSANILSEEEITKDG